MMNMPTLTRAQWGALASAALVMALVLWLLSPRPLDVETAPVRRGAIAESVSDQGVMRVREAFIVSAPVAGRLERLSLKVGDRVSARDTIARIRPMAADFLDPRAQAQARASVSAAQSALSASQAEVRSAGARRDMAERELTRAQSLASSGIVSKQALENAQMTARTARSAEQAAIALSRAQRADLAAARAALMGPNAPAGGLMAITAPTRGVVTRVFQESERPITSGAPILEIGDRGGLEAAIEFLSQDAVRIKEGQDAEILDWGGAPLAAQVRRVEPQGFTKVSALGVEEQRVLVLLQIKAPSEQWVNLGAGYRVWGRVILRTAPEALLTPIGALVRQGDNWAVFVVQHGRAQVRIIKVGAMNDRDAEVLEGLKPNESVIVFPSDKVADGVRIQQRKKERGANG